MTRSPRLAILAALAVVLAVLTVLRGSAFGGGADSYAFEQQENNQPVTWNHCRPIAFQVNPVGAPTDWHTIVSQAVYDIGSASGFTFHDAGTTTSRTVYEGGLYAGNSAQPVLIEWSDTLQSPTLSDAWGYAIPLIYDLGDHRQILSGQIVMGTHWFQHYSTVSDERVQTVVLEHELGHILGLGHVEDHRQVMNNGYAGQSKLGAGDIAGLKKLAAVPCA